MGSILDHSTLLTGGVGRFYCVTFPRSQFEWRSQIFRLVALHSRLQPRSLSHRRFQEMENNQKISPTSVGRPASSPSSFGTGKLLKADPISDTFRTDIQRSISEFTSRTQRNPRLIGILATRSKPSEMYAEFTRKTCVALGVDFLLKRVGVAASGVEGSEDVPSEGPGGVEEAVVEANADDAISGILVCVVCFARLWFPLHDETFC